MGTTCTFELVTVTLSNHQYPAEHEVSAALSPTAPTVFFLPPLPAIRLQLFREHDEQIVPSTVTVPFPFPLGWLPFH